MLMTMYHVTFRSKLSRPRYLTVNVTCMSVLLRGQGPYATYN